MTETAARRLGRARGARRAAAGRRRGALGAWLSSLERRLPTGPIIVLSSTALLVVSLLVVPRLGLLWAAGRRVSDENLLKALWRLGEMDAGQFDAPRAVSDVLAVRAAPPKAVENARADGLVQVEGPLVELTPAGLARAGRVVRNHRIWELYLSGVLREIYFRADQHSAVLVLECTTLEEAWETLNTFPLVQTGLLEFDLIPLAPYTGFERLFTPLV